MKAKLSSLLLLAAVCGSVTALSQTESTSFVIGNDTYYLHKIAYHPLSSDKPNVGKWNQNMVADRQYIYIADHVNISNSANQLNIKRYIAYNGERVDDLIIDYQELYNKEIDLMTDDQRCFYLVPANDNEHLILFPNITESTGIKPDENFSFFLIDKTGHIIRDFTASPKTFAYSFFDSNNPIGDFGIPEIIGNPVSGDFDIFIPMTNWNGESMIAKYSYLNSVQSTSYSVYNCPNGTSTNTKPTVHIIDDNYMIVDDIDMVPSLYSYNGNYNNCYGTLDCINKLGHGCNYFNYSGHRLLYIGDIEYSDNNNTNGTTQFKIGLWEDYSELTQNISRANPTISFDNFTPLTTLSFGESTAKKAVAPYTYRQFMATSDFGDNVMHLHFYVPGEFLATYQLNKYERPTDVENITNIADNHTVSYRISDKNMIFDCPVADVSVFNMTGHQIFHSTTPVKSINFANFVKGTYIIATPYNSFKIFL